jgi:hypothetical protein
MAAYFDQLGLLSEYFCCFFFGITKKQVDIILFDNSLHSVLLSFLMTTRNAALAAVPIIFELGSMRSVCDSLRLATNHI